MKSKSPEYYSLKLVPSDDLKERIKLNPAFKNASEKLDPELKQFDKLIERIGAVKVRKDLHDPDDKMEMCEDFDVDIA